MEHTKEAKLISYLRRDGRIGLTKLSKATGVPISTIFDQLQSTAAITRYCALLDFSAINFGCRAIILVRTIKEKKNELGTYLLRHPHVNTLHKINNGLDYCFEGVFRDLTHIETFLESLEERFPLKTKQVHYLLDELKREGFLADPENAGLVITGKLS